MIIKNRKIYWLLSLTWGIVMSFIGLLAAAGALCLGARPIEYNHSIVFFIGKYWGSVNLGPVIFMSKTQDIDILAHEYGHSIQNCVFGPGMIIISIMSFIRAAWYKFTEPKTDYYSIWFEKQATDWGSLNNQGI